ncbi:hypothetical protein PIB30_072519 [Stylosanthes scabra]|uniref:Uncharacterized protein n=1 Tax=Stylosanthes scabra TaxID=79078 RepID=A0ABU6UMY5_9FABA|nr:hypothetical protein [Stylosanthes scabra]
MDRIKTIMKFEGPLNSETSYRARMVEGNQDLDAVTRDICVEGAVWSLGARNNPLYLKRSDLNPVAREMEISFLASGPIEAMPKARPITPVPADGYGWGQLQEDMANMSKNQTEFYDSMLAQQTAYGLRLQEMETRQQEMCHIGKLHAAHEEQKNNAGQTHQVLVSHAMESQTGNMYTHWALQQTNQNLVPMIPTKIPPAIRENFKAGRPFFMGCYALGH